MPPIKSHVLCFNIAFCTFLISEIHVTNTTSKVKPCDFTSALFKVIMKIT